MTKILTRALVSVSIALAVVFGSATAALANPTVYGCPDSYLCFYEHVNYEGGQYKFHVQALYPFQTCLNFPNSGQTGWTGGQVNNKISSVILNGLEVEGGTQFYVYAFHGSNCSVLNGDVYYMAASSGVAAINNLTLATPNQNDVWTSVFINYSPF